MKLLMTFTVNEKYSNWIEYRSHISTRWWQRTHSGFWDESALVQWAKCTDQYGCCFQWSISQANDWHNKLVRNWLLPTFITGYTRLDEGLSPSEPMVILVVHWFLVGDASFYGVQKLQDLYEACECCNGSYYVKWFHNLIWIVSVFQKKYRCRLHTPRRRRANFRCLSINTFSES